MSGSVVPAQRSPRRCRGVYARKNANVECLEGVLRTAELLGLHFKGVTFLAKYCAQRMTEILAGSPSMLVPFASVQSRVSSPVIGWKSLLKDPIYRDMLNCWIADKGPQISAESSGHSQIRLLQRDLLSLRNRYERLNEDFLELQARHSFDTPKLLADSSGEDGFIIAHSLIKYFSSFIDVIDGNLVEKSPAKPTLVSKALFQSYLSWLQKEL